LHWSHGVCLPIEQIDVRLRGLDYFYTQDDTVFTERSALPDRGALEAGRMFTLGGCILVIVFVLLLLHLLLLLLLPPPPHPLINRIGIACRANQPVFACYASTSMKTTLSTELVLW
jgi:hypothetical protein